MADSSQTTLAPSARRRRRGGFTLVEVLVALAIASGALVLILSAATGSLRRTVHAGLSTRLERAAESRLADWQSGADRSTSGPLAGFLDHRWEIRTLPEPVSSLRGLRRVTLAVQGPDGRKVLEWSVLAYGGSP
jgi:prepilin-type N-terminal cleavage/methylation domain-containing protein